jgi:protein SCO1/2
MTPTFMRRARQGARFDVAHASACRVEIHLDISSSFRTATVLAPGSGDDARERTKERHAKVASSEPSSARNVQLHFAATPALLCLLLTLSTACAKHYRIEGLVLQVDPSARTILVSHRPIDNYMSAMTMPFHVAPHEDLSTLAPGTRLTFDLSVGKHASIARNLKPKIVKLEADGKEIRVDPPPNKIALGATVPDFTLTDQSNRTVHLSDFHGRVIAIDFIYTRCPLPDVCPRLSANFASVAKRLIAPTSSRDIQLLSITIDPQYDTPAVLTEYAHRYGADGQSWRFLTGSFDRIRDVAGIFGLVYWPEEGSITHTVATAVIGRDGKLAALIDGSSYRPEQLRDLIQHTLER